MLETSCRLDEGILSQILSQLPLARQEVCEPSRFLYVGRIEPFDSACSSVHRFLVYRVIESHVLSTRRGPGKVDTDRKKNRRRDVPAPVFIGFAVVVRTSSFDARGTKSRDG